MAPLLHPAVLLTLAGALSCALPAHSAMFRWVDESGSVTYSNTPPREPAKVTDIVRIEGPPPPPRHSEPAVAAPAPGIAKPEPAAPRSDAPRREAEGSKPDDATRAATPVSGPTAVQDPCLKSADPQCYERNKDKYHPYLGYAPGTARPAPAVGATAGGAGGAVGRQVLDASPVKPAQPGTPASTPAINVKTK